MPLTKEHVRNRPKNKKNIREEQARQSEQARWLLTGSAATQEERLGLPKDADSDAADS